MTARALMIMGTGSDVGKSVLVAGLCRILADRGLVVRPFKPQNMSNNAAVTAEGGEIGRAQALQARAARLEPITAMNPVLLKPEYETGAQLVVRGKRRGSLAARDYFARRSELMPEVLAAFSEVARGADFVLVEGAGSAAEINLRATDIANFGFARAANVPVVVAGDIERGGVIAALVGTLEVIDPADAALVRATLVNRFRGDVGLFENGMAEIASRTGRPVFGPVPFFADAFRLPAEDVLGLDASPDHKGAFKIAVLRLPRIANFDDLDPLRADPALDVVLVGPGQPVPQDADLIIVPGSKSTRADLAFLRAEGWDVDIKAHYRAGKPVLGLCGGYQMLGTKIADPHGVEGVPGTDAGLGLLDVNTVLITKKNLARTGATHVATGTEISGYRMHMGETVGLDCARPFATIAGTHEGATSADGLVMGTYMHGLFARDGFRREFLKSLGVGALAVSNYERSVEAALDGWAAHLSAHLDVDGLLALAGPVK